MQPAVALNGRFSGTRKPTGTQTASYHLFDALVRAKRTVPLVVFADPEFPGIAPWQELENTRVVPVPFGSWSRAKAQLWEQFSFPAACRRHQCTLAHHPMNTCPRFPGNIKTIVTVHDLNFYLHPEWYSRAFRLVYKFFAIPGIRKANLDVVISDYVAQQVVAHLHIPPAKLRRIYNGVKPLPTTEPDTPAVPPYLLCVGSLQPHKNLPRLVRAFNRVRSDYPDLQLWIIGRPQAGFQTQPELAELLRRPGVEMLGYVSESALGRYYRQARLFCFPSLEEGFGLPVLEAMASGVPVLTSNVSCLPEISGPAAELVDPYSDEALAAGIRKLLRLDPAERERRIAEGKRWVQQFTWERAAQDYLNLYQTMLRS